MRGRKAEVETVENVIAQERVCSTTAHSFILSTLRICFLRTKKPFVVHDITMFKDSITTRIPTTTIAVNAGKAAELKTIREQMQTSATLPSQLFSKQVFNLTDTPNNKHSR